MKLSLCKNIVLGMLMLSTSLYAQTGDFYTPVKPNSLRLPSVPLVVTDPHFSIWTPCDHLYDGPTEHWSNHVKKPLIGLLRVDGEAYRFMGATTESLFPLALRVKAKPSKATHLSQKAPLAEKPKKTQSQ